MAVYPRLTVLPVGQGACNLVEVYDQDFDAAGQPQGNLIYLEMVDCGTSPRVTNIWDAQGNRIGRHEHIGSSLDYVKHKMRARAAVHNAQNPPPAQQYQVYLDSFDLTHQDNDHWDLFNPLIKHILQNNQDAVSIIRSVDNQTKIKTCMDTQKHHNIPINRTIIREGEMINNQFTPKDALMLLDFVMSSGIECNLTVMSDQTQPPVYIVELYDPNNDATIGLDMRKNQTQYTILFYTGDRIFQFICNMQGNNPIQGAQVAIDIICILNNASLPLPQFNITFMNNDILDLYSIFSSLSQNYLNWTVNNNNFLISQDYFKYIVNALQSSSILNLQVKNIQDISAVADVITLAAQIDNSPIIGRASYAGALYGNGAYTFTRFLNACSIYGIQPLHP